MTRTIQKTATPYHFHFPAGATIVTCCSRGRSNALAVAWHTAISGQPPLYAVSIAPRRFSHELIQESGEFVVNFMPLKSAELVAMVGRTSGRNIDKFKEFGITTTEGTVVKTPVLTDAMAAYECKVVATHPAGDHDLFVGEIVAIHWETDAYIPDEGLDIDRYKPLVYLSHDRYATCSSPFYPIRKR